MSGYDYNDDEDSSPRGHSRSRSNGNTSNFNTTLLSNDGRFLGMQLSPDMASDFRKFYAVGLDWARRKGEQLGIPLAKKIATALGTEAHKADRIAGKAGDAVGYGIIFSNQLLGVGRNIYDSTKCLNDLRVAVQPLTKAGSGDVSPLSGGNEVVSNARAKIKSIFWQRLGETATSTLAVLPALAFKWKEQKIRNDQRKTIHEIKEATSPDEGADILKKRITLGSHSGDEIKGLEVAAERLMERERAAYKAGLDSFVSQGRNTVKEKLGTILSEFSTENVEGPLQALQELRIPVGQLHRDISHLRLHGDPETADKQIEKLINTFKTGAQKSLDYYAKEALTAEYVGQKGAFDDSYLSSEERRSYRNDRKPTIQEKLQAEIKEIRDAQRKMHEEEKRQDEKGDEISKMAAGLGAGLASEFVTQRLIGKGRNKYNQPIALDRILHLRRKLEEAKDNPPEQVPGITGEKGNTKDVSYVRYVHEIFQQHQRDCSRAEIGDRFTEHFDKVRWDDAAVQEMADDKLSAYEYAVKTLAKRIKDGRMDAIALISLVGDREKKIVRDDGRSFGPSGSGKDEAKIKDAIRKLIDEHSMMLHADQKQTDAEINDKLGNFIFSTEDLKQALSSANMDARERAFLFTIFSDVVGSDEKLCQMLGIDSARCKELRAECKENFNATIDGAVLVLAEMIEEKSQGLEKLKLTDKEKQLIVSLAERVQSEGKNVIDLAENREEIKSLETVVANTAMVLGKDTAAKDESGKMLWTRIVEKAQSIPQMIKDHKKRREEANSNDVSIDHPGVEPRTKHMAHMKKKHKTRFAEEDSFQGMEEFPALSARDRESRRRGATEVQEIG